MKKAAIFIIFILAHGVYSFADNTAIEDSIMAKLTTSRTHDADTVHRSNAVECSQSTSREQPSWMSIPKEFALYQNYPNPFNPQTMIKIETSKATYIELNVYDVRGNKVRGLVSSIQPAGHYFVPWDGTNDDGVLLTSGIYYYRMSADDFIDVKRMIFLR